MKISWVVATGYQLDPVLDIETIKHIGPIWGGYTTWRSCGTDNVVCHSVSRAQELVRRNFHQKCNFYTYHENFQIIGRPNNIKLYHGMGDFELAVDNIDDIVAMNLAASTSDIVLLLGFDFGNPEQPGDQFELHKITNRHGLIRSCIAQNSQVQWLVVDHSGVMNTRYAELSNLSSDKMENVLQLLAQ